MRMNEYQREIVFRLLKEIRGRSPFYARKFEGIDLESMSTQEDFESLPFTDKADLREAYPLGLAAVPRRDIVRIHSSSGTTGTPVVIPYTARDVEDWAVMFERCYRMAGVTEDDVIQITPGYGLWTAGIGFQAGCERLGAMAVPMGPGNTEKQLRMMEDLGTTVLTATSSYALLLAEEIKGRGMKDRLRLRKGIIGSERWGERMRREIADDLGVEFYDIYGLTEIYGPGIGISCDYRNGIHMWDDYIYFEIIDPKTGETVPDGTVGELVITTLRKEGAPLIRYRTHDLTRIIPGDCPCGSRFPRIDIIVGRTDDMVKVKGVNMFPAQFDEVLAEVDGVSCEYQVMIDHLMGRDEVTVYFETPVEGDGVRDIERDVVDRIKSRIGITVIPKAVPVGYLPRSEKKTNRIFDNRYRSEQVPGELTQVPVDHGHALDLHVGAGQIRHERHPAARCIGGADAVRRVLHGQAVPRSLAHALAGVQVHVRAGLAASDRRGADDGVEPVVYADPGQVVLRMVRARRGGHGRLYTARAQRIQDLVHPGLHLDPVGLHVLGHEPPALGADVLHHQARMPSLQEFLHEFGVEAADVKDLLGRQLEPEGGGRPLPEGHVEPLGVDERAVHVEDDGPGARGDRHRCLILPPMRAMDARRHSSWMRSLLPSTILNSHSPVLSIRRTFS